MKDRPFIKRTTLLAIEALTNRNQYPDTDLEIWAETEARPQPGDIIHLGNNNADENLIGVLVHSCRMVITTEECRYFGGDKPGVQRCDRPNYETTTCFLITGELVSMVKTLADITKAVEALKPSKNTRKICIWPNRDWCDWDELEDYGRNKSDDFYTVDVSLDIDDEKLDQMISEGLYDQPGANALMTTLAEAWTGETTANKETN